MSATKARFLRPKSSDMFSLVIVVTPADKSGDLRFALPEGRSSKISTAGLFLRMIFTPSVRI